MKISLANQSFQTKWNKFVFNQPQSFFYHDFRWQKIAKQLGFKPQYFIAREKGKLTGLLPLFIKKGLLGGTRLVSLPFGEAGPLGETKIQRQLIDEALTSAKRLNANLEIISPQKIAHLPKGLVQRSEYSYYILETDLSYQKIFEKSFHKKTRNMIRKADKAGIRATSGSINDLGEFYDLYLKTMRKLGALPFPYDVFIKTWDSFSKETKLLRAVFKRETIGFLWIFEWNKAVWIWANATEEKYLPLGVNYALYSEAVKLACKDKQIEQVNFGGSEPDSSQEFFKLRWGAGEKPVFMISNHSSGNQKEGLQKRLAPIIKNMPIFLVRIMGKLAYKIY